MHTRLLVARYFATTFCYIAVKAASEFCSDAENPEVAEKNAENDAFKAILLMNADLIADTLKFAVTTAVQYCSPPDYLEAANLILLRERLGDEDGKTLAQEKLNEYDDKSQKIIKEIMDFRRTFFRLSEKGQAQHLFQLKLKNEAEYKGKIKRCLRANEREKLIRAVALLETPTVPTRNTQAQLPAGVQQASSSPAVSAATPTTPKM